MTAIIPLDARREQAKHERERLAGAWPDEWRDGARAGHFQKYDGEREPGGYPKGFHGWPLDRRNAWYAAFTYGFRKRLRENGR